jgi:hypothetical protein
MKKLFIALSLVFVLEANTFARTGDVLEIVGMVGMAAGLGTEIVAYANKDEDLYMTGIYIAAGGTLIYLIGAIMNRIDASASLVPEKPNPIVEHLQLGIMPNAAGYAGFKFKF